MSEASDKPGRSARWILATCIGLYLILLLGRLGLVWFSSPELLVSVTPDDAYYYLGVSRNIANGAGSSFDGLQATNGYHPLWTMIGSAIALVMRVDATSYTESLLFARLMFSIQLFLGLIATAIISQIINRHFGWVAICALLLFMVSPFLVYAVTDGMESGLVVLFLATLLGAYTRFTPFDEKYTEKDVAFGALLALGVMARLDLALYCVAIAIVAIVYSIFRDVQTRESRFRWLFIKGVAWGGPVILTVLLYTYLNTLQFDSATPISGKLKNSFPDPDFNIALLRAYPHHFAIGVFAVIAGLLLYRVDAIDKSIRLYLAAGSVFVILHALNTLLFMRWGVHNWHFTTYWLFAAINAAILFPIILSRLKNPAIPVPVVALLMLLCLAFQVRFVSGRTDYAFQARSLKAALWTRENIPGGALIGMSDCGVFGYVRGSGVVNLDGVINNKSYQDALVTVGIVGYLDQRNINYIAHHAITANAVAPGYGTYDYTAYSRLYDQPGGTVSLREADEKYRSPVYNDGTGEKVFVIWALPPSLGRFDGPGPP